MTCLKCKIKRPSFNYPGEKKPIYCSDCKEENMVDVKHNKVKKIVYLDIYMGENIMEESDSKTEEEIIFFEKPKLKITFNKLKK